jgi:hypothetical protein
VHPIPISHQATQGGLPILAIPAHSPHSTLDFRLLFSLPEVCWGLVCNVGNEGLYLEGRMNVTMMAEIWVEGS